MSHKATDRVRFAHRDNALLAPNRPVDMGKPVVVNAPRATDSSGSSGDEGAHQKLGSLDEEGQYEFAPPVPTPLDNVPPLAGSQGHSWATSSRRGIMTPAEHPPPIQTNGATKARPSAVRTPSNAYTPSQARRPQQFSLNTTTGNHRTRTSSANRSRRNPNAEYRAQEKAYVQRIRQENEQDEFFEVRTPSLGYSTDTDSDDESPSTADYTDNDPYDQETLLYYGNEDMQPSVEELKIPANRERLEWHSMLANVLTGDVVKQEKKRLIGSTEQQADSTLKAEIWMGVRARVCGRTLQAQRRLVDDKRANIRNDLESIITFEVQGAAEAGQTPAAQVAEVVKKIEQVESLYPTRQTLEQAYPRAASQLSLIHI